LAEAGLSQARSHGLVVVSGNAPILAKMAAVALASQRSAGLLMVSSNPSPAALDRLLQSASQVTLVGDLHLPWSAQSKPGRVAYFSEASGIETLVAADRAQLTARRNLVAFDLTNLASPADAVVSADVASYWRGALIPLRGRQVPSQVLVYLAGILPAQVTNLFLIGNAKSLPQGASNTIERALKPNSS
jgi:hypothetical protein